MAARSSAAEPARRIPVEDIQHLVEFGEDRRAELDDASLRIVYTRESPSSFLLDLTIADFELANRKVPALSI